MVRISAVVLASVLACGAAQAADNVALTGTASQSSHWGGVGNGNAQAANAIDGITAGNYYDGNVSHTNNGAGYSVGNGFEWWQVALGADYSIDSITVWNRTDCCVGRLSQFTASVWNDGVQVWSGEYDASGPAPSTSFAGIGMVGDTVMVQLNRQDYLHLAEVQVFANPVPEPGSAALLLAGLGAGGWLVRRRRA